MRKVRAVLSLLLLISSCLAFADTLKTNGGTIYYEKTGLGPAIILLHGGFGDLRMWEDQIQPFARDHQVIRYDQPGFGKSSPPDKPYSPVSILAQLMNHLAIQEAILIGNSMGGTLAIDFALTHPQRVDRMILVASGPGGYPVSKQDMDRMNSIFSSEPEKAVEMWLNDPMVAVTAKSTRTKIRLTEMVRANISIFRLRYWPIEKMDPPAYGRLGEIRKPTLVIIGDTDTALVQKLAGSAATGIPNARKEVMKNADHLPQMTNPEEFNRLVLEFLNDPPGDH